MSKASLFLQRWARRKLEAEHTATESNSADMAGDKLEPRAPAELPPVESLTLDSDFSGFMQPEVDTKTRAAALKKLFMTDHYRTMDMLDVYVDDYSAPELLPTELLTQLQHASALLLKPEKAQAEAESSNPLLRESMAHEAQKERALDGSASEVSEEEPKALPGAQLSA